VAICELCGNDYDKAMEVTVGGESHTFDSFECGHGVEAGGRMFCCAHCARESGATGVVDRA